MKSSAQNLLVTALDERWEVYRRQFKTCQHEFSEEAVHDLRIAVRRFLAVLDIVRDLIPEPHVQKARRLFKNELDELDELRDVQVMLVDVLEAQASIPQLETFRPFLERREKSLMRSAHQRTKLSRLYGLKKRVDRMRAALLQQSNEVSSASALLQPVDRAYARLCQAYSEIDARKLATIHQTRIAFKKFRYMAEIISPLLPSAPPDYFRCMHDYQSAMGNIRDIAVFLDVLTDFGRGGELPSITAPIRRYFRTNLRQLVAIFMKEKGDLTSFWRPGPDQPFPWAGNQGSRKLSASRGDHRKQEYRGQDKTSAQSNASDKSSSRKSAPGENERRAQQDLAGGGPLAQSG